MTKMKRYLSFLKSAEIKEALRTNYDIHFDNNILKSQERYERLAKQYGEGEERKERLAHMTDADFSDLLRELGFSSPVSP